MNPVERFIRGIDGWQQRTRGVNVVFAVIKKFGDDRGSSLAAMLAFYGLLALFPLLLVLTTILGFIGNQRLESGVVGSTLSQFPVYGQQIGHNVSHPLQGSTIGLTVGLLGLLYGSLGVAQAGQHAMAQIWNVPGVVRPGFVPRLVRSLLLFGAMGAGMAASAVVSGVITGSGRGIAERLLAVLTAATLNVGLYFVVFRLLTPRQIATRHLAAGAAAGGIGYTILTTGGTALIQHQLRHAQAVWPVRVHPGADRVAVPGIDRDAVRRRGQRRRDSAALVPQHRAAAPHRRRPPRAERHRPAGGTPARGKRRRRFRGVRHRIIGALGARDPYLRRVRAMATRAPGVAVGDWGSLLFKTR
ncbi:MAG: hypothetical protein QOE57_696 [Acidimicrobiaceae bacterium]|nr:hypothetical protein [Acidimicrobiaceae bacterium]